MYPSSGARFPIPAKSAIGMDPELYDPDSGGRRLGNPGLLPRLLNFSPSLR
jgi:hypothetical protein